jgi:hypothetical protein
MNRWTKTGITALAILAGVLASAFLGGSVGFFQGYGYALGNTAARAMTLTVALRSIRGGNTDEGVALLESDLDSLIMTHWAANRTDPSLLSWLVRGFGDSSVERKLFATVARYRAEYPTTAVDPDVRETIASHLKTFQAQ